MCMPVDRAALQCWLMSQLAVLSALRDEAALQLEGENGIAATLAGHHAWLMRELEQLAPAAARA